MSALRILRRHLPVILAGIFLIGMSLPLNAQQITRVAVVNIARILAAFPIDQDSLKNFEAKKAEIQAEINAMTAEVRELSARKAELESMGAVLTAKHYGNEIDRKTQAVKEYAAQRQNELDIMAKVAGANLSFVQRLGSTIARVAEAEGYSLVLNLAPEDKKSDLVLWNSPSVDITDKVIQALSIGQ
jgi:outer membrane protein